ncbi:hypothetical protein TSAR_010504 [Trichomalopsis sarcophagae]|uniref:Uncharacterized protein n=1 Tax=Trichomalopsis sarcophagae TaxID=543379 RepID=A0A232FK18_9HYME|nr:hypothetical protein TSAR_010504 [Trichomalopsis sarcophagae]
MTRRGLVFGKARREREEYSAETFADFNINGSFELSTQMRRKRRASLIVDHRVRPLVTHIAQCDVF